MPWIVARLFPYQPEYIKTPFLKTIKVFTRNQLPNAKFIIRLYSINEKGEPENYIFDKKIIGIAKKGRKITAVDLSAYSIPFPKNGFFIAVEWLIIDDNKREITYTLEGTKKKINDVRYEPIFGAIPGNSNENSWVFRKGKWVKFDIQNRIPEHDKNKYSLLAIELILSN